MLDVRLKVDGYLILQAPSLHFRGTKSSFPTRWISLTNPSVGSEDVFAGDLRDSLVRADRPEIDAATAWHVDVPPT
jgi:hypothetical protein